MANIEELNKKSTTDKAIGLLVNGVELYPPSLFNEVIHYGEVVNVNILDSGSNYDVIVPPKIEIIDPDGNGSGAKVHANMKGVLKEVTVINPGIGYDRKPTLSLIGGNGKGLVKLDTNLVKKIIRSEFYPNSIGIGNTTITFLSDHNFKTGDEVLYDPNNYSNVTGLDENTLYYVRVVDSNTISLFKRYLDALKNINVVSGLSAGLTLGLQYIYTSSTKPVIDSVYIENFDSELYNKSIKIGSVQYNNNSNINGINLTDNFIFASNHNFNEKDLVIYKTTGVSISGLTTTNKYYVTVIDENKFKLSVVGNNLNDDNYINKNYVNLNSVGVGTHIFSYPPIEIKIENTSGNQPTTPLELKPVVLGEIESIFIENKGISYGVSDIINLKRNPIAVINEISNSLESISFNASLQPIIRDGAIVDVIVLKSGKNYEENIDIIVGGDGKYAKLYPVLENGEIIDVLILNPGVGYNQLNSNLFVRRRGENAKLSVDIKKWTINQYFKYKDIIDNSYGNGFIIPSKLNKNSSQFINFYPPKQLIDLLEVDEETSPILGWAYDGNPILGEKIEKINNVQKYAKSSYELNVETNKLKRPDKQDGYFIEDYVYNPNLQSTNNEIYLDEYNGMFINNRKDFPNGTYAYFCTLDEGSPSFPYIIGPEFKNLVNEINYDPNYNQNIDFKDKKYIKNTSSLYLTDSSSGYDCIKALDEKYKQEIVIKNVLSSNIDGFDIIESGTNYKVGDKVKFIVENEEDAAPNAEVSEIKGKVITNITIGISTINNLKFKNLNNKIEVYSETTPHNLKNNQYVYVSSDLNSQISGMKKIEVKSKISTLLTDLDSSGTVKLITLNDINDFNVGDFIKIGNEIAKIAKIYYKQNKFLIHRLSNIESHSKITSQVILLSSKFSYNKLNFDGKLSIDNLKYFDPKVSVGLGTTGSFIQDNALGSNYFVDSQQIYIENHGFEQNQKVIYNHPSEINGLRVSNTPTSAPYRLNDGQILYTAVFNKDFIGLTTVSYGTTYLTYRESSYSENEIHSLNFIGTSFTGKAEIFNLNIDTNNSHLLENDDYISFIGEDDTWEKYVCQFDLNSKYPVSVQDSNSFSINLFKKPDFIKYSTSLDSKNINYITNSKNSKGGISDIKLIYSSSFYKDLPIVDTVESSNGTGATILPISSKIGKVDTVERIKDGFDYPSDITLQPKLSSNTICYVNSINKVDSVSVLKGGEKYNSPPTLKVIGNDQITLTAILRNSSVKEVVVNKTPNNLSQPLQIIPINNSNGIDILNIYPLTSTINRIELDITQFPLIYRDYLEPIIDFPFQVNDLIFIENCNLISSSGKKNYNSENHDYSYFKVVGINSELGRVDYLTNYSGPLNFGTYTTKNGFGIVVNENVLPNFEMILKKNNYINGESVVSSDENGVIRFSGQLYDTNGWDENRNQLRITKTYGNLKKGDIVKGTKSLLEGKVSLLKSFSIETEFGDSRDKENSENSEINLSISSKKLQDGNYYQDFSYSIISDIPYGIWEEPVKSIIHPSGFKEFSELKVVSEPINRLKAKTSNTTLALKLNIDRENSFFTRKNYTIAYEEPSSLTKTERILFGSNKQTWPVAASNIDSILIQGIAILPYVLNKTNTITNIKPVDSSFTGTYESVSIGKTTFTFIANEPYHIGVNTSGLKVGDLLGISTYNQFPYNTKIIAIETNKIRILNPHKVYDGNKTELLEVRRNLNQNTLVGLTSFRLVDTKNEDIFKINVPIVGINTINGVITVQHKFENGQLVRYKNVGGSPIGIANTDQVIGGISTNILPPLIYINRLSNNTFKVSGIQDSKPLTINSKGSGTHQFIFENPNASTLITIDGIIQSPLYLRPITLTLNGDVDESTTTLEVSSGISSISSIDIIKIEDEYFKINNIGISSPNSIEVERGLFGSSIQDHTGITEAQVYRGNYSIEEDIIHFTSPPFGPKGLKGLEVTSKFTGRVFNRTFSSERPNDVNYIFDDISDQFVNQGIFKLKENGSSIVGVYTNTNDPVGSNINNIPLILLNSIPQTVNISYDIQDEIENEIVFLDEYPNVGKIINFEINQSFGYTPLVAAAATVSVSGLGTISNVYLNGNGQGYRQAPGISIISSVGTGAEIEATIDVNGKVDSLNIVNSGSGYDPLETPIVIIDEPLPYSNLDLEYSPSSSGIGTNAKISLKVANDSSIENVIITNSGINYKNGDILNVKGVIENPDLEESFVPLEITVKEVVSDTFSGFYPGQFLQLNDISTSFDGKKDSFELFAVLEGETRRISFRSSKPLYSIENNFFIFINDVLQEPKKSYIYSNGVIVFTEPPKEDSTCNILYFVGSYYDVEFVVPLQTIKEGDILKFEDNELLKNDVEQSERTVKRLISSNSLDTFPYGGVGISSIFVRPISWTKQKNDRIINGSFISKSRQIQNSKLFPTSRLIWNVKKEDTSIYVDNAYPLFVELDDGINGLIEGKRNIRLIDHFSTFENSAFNVEVSNTSIISSIGIGSSGSGYNFIPDILISNPKNNFRDPLFIFNTVNIVETSYDFNSATQGYILSAFNNQLESTYENIVIAVGNSSSIYRSSDLINWEYEDISILGNIDLQKIGVSTENTYVAVGNSGSIIMRDSNSNWNLCVMKSEVLGAFNNPIGLVDSSYTGTFNDVVYNPHINTWISVGDSGKIYVSAGAGNTVFVDKFTQLYDYKSITYNSNLTVAVGHSGGVSSVNGITWNRIISLLGKECNCIIWDEDKFIITTNSGIYTLNSSADITTLIINSPTNLNKIIKFEDSYVANDFNGNVYTSVNLINWEQRSLLYVGDINEIKKIVWNDGNNLVLVGTSGTIFYTIPEIHKAQLSAQVTNGKITSVDVIDSGYGYLQSSPPIVIAESPTFKYENILSVKAKGDYGKIVGINTSNTEEEGSTISFELLTEYSSSGYESLNLLGIDYSQLEPGDYFIVTNSNVSTITGYALTGITTFLGGLSNYPESRVGTANSYLDGVYRVDIVESTNVPQGIVTVTCHVLPVNGGIALNTAGVTTNYYGNYSWSKLYDFNDRDSSISSPLSFEVNTNNGIIGIKTSPIIYRYPPLLF